jgi:hypothetical protein
MRFFLMASVAVICASTLSGCISTAAQQAELGQQDDQYCRSIGALPGGQVGPSELSPTGEMCARQADARGLHGAERAAFDRSCHANAIQAAPTVADTKPTTGVVWTPAYTNCRLMLSQERRQERERLGASLSAMGTALYDAGQAPPAAATPSMTPTLFCRPAGNGQMWCDPN